MLILPIKKKWLDMILLGEKKEEYREIKPYWAIRFQHEWQGSMIGGKARRKVIFRNGYGQNAPTAVAVVTLDTGLGKEEWGAEPGKEYYVLRILDIKRL